MEIGPTPATPRASQGTLLRADEMVATTITTTMVATVATPTAVIDATEDVTQGKHLRAARASMTITKMMISRSIWIDL